MYTKCN